MVLPKPALTQGQVFQIESFVDKGFYYGSIKLWVGRHKVYDFKVYNNESNKTGYAEKVYYWNDNGLDIIGNNIAIM